ncbi:MAG TPA: FtsQ-type POTRA domain-containing protein [Opitutus sp.]|nr:FtsQ-type POTRA domain-containing protein [Opitutus sp.]
MNRHEIIAPPARSWREIPQQVKPRAMSREGRRRVAWSATKTVAAIVILGGLTWGGVQIAAMLQGNAQKIAAAGEAHPVKDVVLLTDGVLDQRWLVRTLALPKAATLMQLDLYQLRSRLTASGQVRAATLTRTFPATLTVTLTENSPVARVMAQDGSEPPHMLLVARDGTVFAGEGFDPEMIETLPWLDGVALTRRGQGFAPIAGMEKAADLLGKAKLETEPLYRTWHVVSLARLESDREIVVQAQDGTKIVFGTAADFFPQLARLDALLDAARAHTSQPIREINLAIGAQVPVAFADAKPVPGVPEQTLTLPAAAKPAVARIPALPAFPDFQRNTKSSAGAPSSPPHTL